MTYPTISTDSAVQAHYEVCRAAGTSHNLAKIFALGQPPGASTDREFFANRGMLGDQFDGDDEMLKTVVTRARRRGYNPNANDVYLPALANEVGDPAAFVPATGGRAHVKKVCESRGEECRGMVNVKAAATEPQQMPAAIAPDIVEREIVQQIREQPGLKPKRKQLRQQFLERHAPPT